MKRVSMGYGSDSAMPMPYHMALTLGSLIEAAVGGAILGAIVHEETALSARS
jgi:hypothetical protein